MAPLALTLLLRVRTVPSLVDAAVTDSVVAEAEMTLSVLVRVAVVKVEVLRVVVVRVVPVRVVDVQDDEAVVADVVEAAVQVALPLARRKFLLPASKSGNPRVSVGTC
jgi:hypothetical protein